MTFQLVSTPIKPDRSFDTSRMAQGEPGLPVRFRWGKRDLEVAEVIEQGKDYGDCSHGSGERYVRRHVYRVRTTDGMIARIYFQRTFGRGRPGARWWLHSIEA